MVGTESSLAEDGHSCEIHTRTAQASGWDAPKGLPELCLASSRIQRLPGALASLCLWKPRSVHVSPDHTFFFFFAFIALSLPALCNTFSCYGSVLNPDLSVYRMRDSFAED